MKMSKEQELVELIIIIGSMEEVSFEEFVTSINEKGFNVDAKKLLDTLEEQIDNLPKWLQQRIKDRKAEGSWED